MVLPTLVIAAGVFALIFIVTCVILFDSTGFRLPSYLALSRLVIKLRASPAMARKMPIVLIHITSLALAAVFTASAIIYYLYFMPITA